MDLGKKGSMGVRTDYLISGVFSIILGVLLVVFAMDLIPMIIPIIAVILILLGALALLQSFYSDMASYYRQRSGCVLAPRNTYCGQKCTQCIFAQEYVRLINERGPPPQNGV